MFLSPVYQLKKAAMNVTVTPAIAANLLLPSLFAPIPVEGVQQP